MSLMDKMMGAKTDAPKQSPIMSMLSSIIPKEQMEELASNVQQTIQYFKTSIDHTVAQNNLILEQQKQIMERLGISNDGSNGNNRDAA